ncbi:hypothetical protein D7223_08475 [Micromonospora endolithica]|uniref:Uncharacterized protein n=2 Tax=Micromonospora endolithica TaxID=230091 RepID=A0A3A9ZNC9_9ACTN|nr:hypothetical protein D7223_08475 [Micromonospora endolithica]
MRLLGVRISGGSHAHISRQLKRFGVDTSHFTGQAHNRGRPGRRRSSSQVLVKLPPEARRVPGARLQRALAFIGIPEACERCGVGPLWLGRPLVLHVDHVNGDFLDNRPPNLRLLCPNCHSQTSTFAGRNRGVALRPAGADPADQRSTLPASPEETVALLRRVDAGELTAVAAARRLGCTRDHIRTLSRRLKATGTIAAAPRRHDRPVRRRYRDAVLRLALAQPDLGARRIAEMLTEPPDGEPPISHRTVQLILREAGLATIADRRSRLSGSAGVA